jgi:hypothetical protein
MSQDREAMRRAVAPWYRGWMHLAFTVGSSIAVTAALAAQVRAPRARELAAAPIFFLLCSLLEYLEHRWLLHRRTRLGAAAFRIHTLEHHRFFTDRDYRPDGSRDWAFILFPPGLVVGYMLVLVPLFGAAAWFALSPNSGLIVGATGAVYFLLYEVIHFASHIGEAMPGWPLFRRLAEHHRTHHRAELMNDRNFNVVLPLFDWIFRTLS